MAVSFGMHVKLEHCETRKKLHSHAHMYPEGSRQQQVTCLDEPNNEEDWWCIKPKHGYHDMMHGHPINNGDVVRLEHVRTRANLHSHDIPLFCNPGQHEVSAYGKDGNGDANDDWRVECSGQLTHGTPFRLIHMATNHALHSHFMDYPFGQQQVTCYRERDNNDFFKVCETRGGIAADFGTMPMPGGHHRGDGTKWNKVDGGLKQVSVSANGKFIIGVNAADEIYFRHGPHAGWERLAGKLKHVSTNRDGSRIWGVNSSDEIFFCEGVKSGWQKIDGLLKQIHVSANGEFVIGVNSNDDIFSRNGVHGGWNKMSGRLKYVSCNRDGSLLWGVNMNDEVYFCPEIQSNRWEKVDGGLKQVEVSAGGDFVIGTNRNDEVYFRHGVHSGWTKLPINLHHASCNRDGSVLWGVNRNHEVYHAEGAGHGGHHGGAPPHHAPPPQAPMPQPGYPPQQPSMYPPPPGVYPPPGGGGYPPPTASYPPPPVAPGGIPQQYQPQPPQHFPQMTVYTAPVDVACMICGGQGHFDAWDKPCTKGSMHCKGPCAACEGRGQVPSTAQKCMRCEGLGNFDTWAKPCTKRSMHCRDPCNICYGRGVTFPPPPSAYGAPPANVSCILCDGHGYFDAWDKPCTKSSMHSKGPCAACSGSGQIPPTSQRCQNCNGMGNFDTWSKPCTSRSMHRKSACNQCHGRGIKF